MSCITCVSQTLQLQLLVSSTEDTEYGMLDLGESQHDNEAARARYRTDTAVLGRYFSITLLLVSQLLLRPKSSYILLLLTLILCSGCIAQDAKWKTREQRQIHTADPVGVGRKSCLYTMLEYCVPTEAVFTIEFTNQFANSRGKCRTQFQENNDFS